MNYNHKDPKNNPSNSAHHTKSDWNESDAGQHTHYIHRVDLDNEYDSEASQRDYQIDALENLDDWKVHHDDTDVRGWDLRTNTGAKIGTITNLIVDTGAKRVLYLEVETDSGLSEYNNSSYHDYVDASFHTYYETNDHHHILVPVGLVDIDNDEHRVIAAPNLTPAHFASSPRFEGIKKQRVTPVYQLLTAKHYSHDDDYYRAYYNDSDYNLYNYDNTAAITNPGFYKSDFFHRDRYRNRLSNRNVTGFDTGDNKYER